MKTTHDDSGEPLGPLGLKVQRAFLDVDHDISASITRLGNLLKAHPEISERFPVAEWLADIEDTAKELRSIHPHAPCCYCWGKGEKAVCQECRGQRWMTKGELAEAPAELRAAVGL